MAYSEGPDRGHAWVIAFMACIITMILSGISKMVGILYVAVIDTYGVTRQEATLPFTFRKSLRCLAGPIVGIVGQRFGIRAVTLFGSIIAALGAALCFIAPTVTWLAVCWGGIHGLGEAFANTLFQVVVNQYFEKYRSTASGIALSGACIGSVLFSFLIEALRDAYGLQGTFLILSGVILHVFPAAMMLKSPSWVTNGQAQSVKNASSKLNENSNKPRMYTVPDDYVKLNAEKRLSIVSLNPRLLEKNDINSVHNQLPLKSVHSAANLVSSLEKKLDEDKGVDNLVYEAEMNNNPAKPCLEKRLSIQNVFATSKENVENEKFDSCNLKKQISLNGTDKDVEKNNTPKPQQPQKVKSTMENVMTMAKLYTNPIFLLVCFCMALYVFTFIPIMTSMVDYSKDKGLPETVGKYLIHAMAVGDIIGRLCLGWVTDKEFVSIPRYMTMTLFLQGMFVMLLPMTSTLPAFLALLACYSMTAGSMLVRMPVIVLKHVNKDEQSVAMGSYGFVSGLVPLGVPSLIGHFRDHFGAYDGMYYLLGGLSLVSGCVWLLEPFLARIGKKAEVRDDKFINP